MVIGAPILIIILGIVTVISWLIFIIESDANPENKIFYTTFIISFLINLYTVYKNLVSEK